ncbi:Smr/MutS family protein [Azonexus sp.]|uniref:Smr/MutS family protein n=1 Tax=Azonexus sp. TaxID=1872668 RepID=UPI0039E6DF4F
MKNRLQDRLPERLKAQLKQTPKAALKKSALPPLGARAEIEKNAPEPESAAAERAALQAAIVGAVPLPPDNRVILQQPKPPPQPRSRPLPSASALTDESILPAHWQQDVPPRFSDDPQEAALQRALLGVVPLAPRNQAVFERPPPAPQARQHVAEQVAVLRDSLFTPLSLQDRLEGGDEAVYLRAGLAQSVLRDLRRGRWVIQGEIDLHGLNRDEARHQVAAFLQTALHQGKRCLRIVHGKGLGSPQKLSVLRQLLRGWLAQRREVLAYCQAKPQDGGEGALLALLRAARQ